MEVLGTHASELLTGTSGNDDIYGYGGDDTLEGGDGIDSLDGDTGNDLLYGGKGADALSGGTGNDTAYGGEGDDFFLIDGGNDVFHGEAGDDTFYAWFGQSASDISYLTGGSGQDTYELAADFVDPGNQVIVTDFTPGAGGDIVDPRVCLDRSRQDWGIDAGNPFAAGIGLLSLQQDGPDVLVWWDADGNGDGEGPVLQLRLLGVQLDQLVAENFAGFAPDGSDLVPVLWEGTDDDDWIFGSGVPDDMRGYGGDDTLLGNGGDDLLDGGSGNDFILGESGDDTLLGGNGNDELWGWTGSDFIDAGPGADRIDLNGYQGSNGGAGAGTVIGGSGADTITFYSVDPGTPHVIEDFEPGPGGDKLDIWSLLEAPESEYESGNPFAEDARFFILAQSGDDALLSWDPDGAAGAHLPIVFLRLTNTDADDITSDSFISGISPDGTGSPVSLSGDGGEDWLIGTLYGDTLIGSGGNDTLDGRAGDDVVEAGAGDDQLIGSLGDDTLVAGAGNDTLAWNIDAGDDSIVGGDGDDSISDWLGHNTIDGGAGNDSIAATPHGVDSSNLITTGTGRDTLYVSKSSDPDLLITDFQAGPGGDLFFVDGLLSGASGLGDESPFAAGYLRIVQAEGASQLQYDQDGPAGGYAWVTVCTMQGTPASAFVAANFTGRSIVGTQDDDFLVGDWTDDRLQGLGGDDTLDGAGGADTMEGGAGNDLYFVDESGDVVIEGDDAAASQHGDRALPSVGTNIDTVNTQVSYVLTQATENLEAAAARAGLQLEGNVLPNRITGNELANTLAGKGGNDTLDGLGGLDAASFTGSRASFTVTKTAGGFTVTDTSGGEGTDVLANIERLRFGDVSLAFDLDGNAGQVARLLGVVFGAGAVANPAMAGIGLQLADGGVGTATLAQLALDVRLGGDATLAETIGLLYENLVGAQPDAATVAEIAALGMDKVELTLFASQLALNQQRIGFDLLEQAGLAYL